MAFSPRAWGWSGFRLGRTERVTVFPTRVGMVRKFVIICLTLACFPHARGDGPRLPISSCHVAGFSPRAWGWSVLHGLPDHRRSVFPTRVGMVRSSTTPLPQRSRFPHARGDGPIGLGLGSCVSEFSPRAWGWSAMTLLIGGGWPVFPTRVGMVRKRGPPGSDGRCFPHARGDGPHWLDRVLVVLEFSPRAWGWSGQGDCRRSPLRVFPTRVGMVRQRTRTWSEVGRFPHARGDRKTKNDSYPLIYKPRSDRWRQRHENRLPRHRNKLHWQI